MPGRDAAGGATGDAAASVRTGPQPPPVRSGKAGGAQPLTRSISLPLRATSCAIARRFVRMTLLHAQWPGDAEAAVLLSSELVANAMHEAGAPCRLSLTVTDASVRVEVVDVDPAGRILEVPSNGRGGGRGLVLLDAMASAWGSGADGASTTAIWFELASDRLALSRVDQRREARGATGPLPA